VKRLRLCFPQALSSRKLQRDSRFHYLCGYHAKGKVVVAKELKRDTTPPADGAGAA
jgi:hypothetical protein